MDDKDMAMGFSSSSSEERVCLFARNKPKITLNDRCMYRPVDHSWHVIDVIDDDHRDKNDNANAKANAAAVEIQGIRHPFNHFRFSASSNSTVFVFGGRAPFHCDDYGCVTDVWYTDTSSYINGDDKRVYAATGWTKGAPMRYPRIGSSTVSVDEKIYVFGGSDLHNSDTWAEVYDIKSDSWSCLAPPPSDDIWTRLFAYMATALDFDSPVDIFFGHKTTTKLILVFFHPLPSLLPRPLTGSLYSYDVILRNWELLDDSIGLLYNCVAVVSCCSSNIPVLLTINHDDSKLYGYHLGQRKWFKGPVKVVVEDDDDQDDAMPLHVDSWNYCQYFHLVPLGRNNHKLCLLWSYYITNKLTVHCTKLTSFYEDVDFSLAAKVESTNRFVIADSNDLVCCHPLAPRRGKKKGGESPYKQEEEEEEDWVFL